MVDANYTYSFRNPIDNTLVGSTALARNINRIFAKASATIVP